MIITTVYCGGRRNDSWVFEYADRAGRFGDRRGRYLKSARPCRCSTVTVHLKLNHSSTAALAEVTARPQQVSSELPAEAEPPVIELQRADRPYASFYLSFTSSERTVPAVRDWLLRTLQPQFHARGCAASHHRGRAADRHAHLD